jgi:predicted phosphodiesterase
MFSPSRSGLEVLLERSRPSLWEQFWASPAVFLARRLYTATRPPPPRDPIVSPVTVVCVSDTHNAQFELPDGDLLIHAGDLTQSGSFEQLQLAIDWLRSQPHRHKVVVAGNHDLLLDAALDHGPPRGPDLAPRRRRRQRQELDWGDIIHLQDSAVTLTCSNGRQLRVYGSPRSPKHGNWAFQYPRSQNVWKDVVPDDTDILITHGPPKTHLDLNLGCYHLLRELWRVRPSLHVFGHVHEGHGQEWLYYDGLQSAFEGVLTRGGGVLHLLRVIKETLLWCWTPMEDPKTLAVNPSMVGGLRDDQRRRPIVAVI